MNTCLNWLVQGGGGVVTMSPAVPLWPSIVAVMGVDPAATPVTTPLALTGATLVLPLDHVTVRPVSVLPFASFSVAVRVTVRPTTTLGVAGVTVTVATGTCTTVTAELPFCPSLVAVIVAVPATLPVTSPVPLTVATLVLALVHVTVRPVNTLPAASRSVAVSCTVLPSFTLADPGVTVTDATGAGVDGVVTVIAAVPLCPSLVAVMVSAPAASPVTRPLPLTVATLVLSLVHVTVRPVNTLPAASFSVAVSCTALPASTVAEDGVTVTVATGAGGGGVVTVIAAVPLCPSLVAVMVADPAATPLTRPLPLTVATLVLALVHVTVRPVNTLPAASRSVAVSCTVLPACTVAEDGVTVTVATGAGAGGVVPSIAKLHTV